MKQNFSCLGSDVLSMCNDGPFWKLSCMMLVTSFGGQLNGKKRCLVFMEAEDSSEGLFKIATCKKVYKCLEVC